MHYLSGTKREKFARGVLKNTNVSEEIRQADVERAREVFFLAAEINDAKTGDKS